MDAQEEQTYQKMLIHFGREMAETALMELRRVRQKRGDLPATGSPSKAGAAAGAAGAATAAAGSASGVPTSASAQSLTVSTAGGSVTTNDETRTPEPTTPTFTSSEWEAQRSKKVRIVWAGGVGGEEERAARKKRGAGAGAGTATSG